MTSSRPCRRRTRCCASASAATRCWPGSRSAIRSWPPRSMTSRCRSTAAAAASGACAGTSSSGPSRRPPRCCSSPYWACRRSLPASRRWFPTRSNAGSARRSTPRRAPQLDDRRLGAAFECGSAETEQQGRAAFDKLMKQLEAAAALPFPLRPAVIRRPEANAVALPGGRIYVFQGLIDKAERPDEVAGVIAHEIGHVAHRDGTRSVLQGAGLSLLFGDAARRFRRRRRGGDGGDDHPADQLFARGRSRRRPLRRDADAPSSAATRARWRRSCSGSTAASIPGSRILLDHPETQERVAKINAAAGIRADASRCSTAPNGPRSSASARDG